MAHIHYDVHDLRALFELARQGSFNRAADVLAITPSALSKRIAKVEAAVGGMIVERTTRSVGLTPLGKRMLARAEPLLAALDDCMEEARRIALGLEGHISVGCIATVAFSHFPAALAAFKQSFPEVHVNLLDGEGSRITTAVLEREVEFAVTTVFDHQRDLVAEQVATDAFVVACGTDHPLAGKRQVQWSELDAFKLVGFRSHVSTRQLIEDELAGLGVELAWTYEVGSLSSLLGYLTSGKFAAPVPRLLAGFVPGLVAVPLVQPRIERRIFLVRRDSPLSLPAQTLWNEIAKQLRSTAAGKTRRSIAS